MALENRELRLERQRVVRTVHLELLQLLQHRVVVLLALVLVLAVVVVEDNVVREEKDVWCLFQANYHFFYVTTLMLQISI